MAPDGASAPVAPALFQPSEYTAMVLQFLLDRPELVRGRRVCEIGSGNGVIAAQAALLGAAHLTVTDIETRGLDTARGCLEAGPRPEGGIDYLLGSVWAPAADRQFGLVLANLPHFPAEQLMLPGRIPSWGAGGADGRAILDPFLDGLHAHLEPEGIAVFTHNTFAGIEQTRRKVERQGLCLCTGYETIVHLPPIKIAALAQDVAAFAPEIFSIGHNHFGRVSLAIVSREPFGDAT